MRAVPPGLAARLETDVTTTCRAWRLTRRDGAVLGFTEHDRDLAFAGTSFQSGSGFLAGEVASELGLAADAAEIAGAFSSAAIDAADLAAGRYDGALVETFIVDWRSPDDHLLLSTRELGEVTASTGAFRAELRSLAARLDAPQGRVYSRLCDARLGDGRCRADTGLPAFCASGTLSAAGEDGTCRTADLAAFPAGWFRLGRLDLTSGRHAGLGFEIADHAVEAGEARITLWAPPQDPPAPGDGFVVTAGCDKTRETCRDKFGNILNFQGFCFMPGSDFAYGYADGDTVHDGRPVVP